MKEQLDSYIRESKNKCQSLYNLDPNEVPYLPMTMTEQQLQLKQQMFAKILGVVKHFMQKLIHYMEGIPVLVLISDDEGYVLDVYGDPSIKEMAETLGIVVGARFTEQEAGTNSITLALKHEKPLGLIGDDHFHHCLAGAACYSAPFYYAGEGKLAGTVSMMTMVDYASHFHLGLLCSAVDTIEKEIHLQEQNDQLDLLNRVLIDSTPIGIVMIDMDGRILEYNASAEAIIEMKKEAVVNGDRKQFQIIWEYMQHVLKTGDKIENMEFSFAMTGKETSKVLLLDVFPLFDGHQMLGAFAQFRDMSRYHELQKQVIESEKLSAIGKLGTGLAHEIRNPLTSIMGLTELLQQNNHQNKYLEIITGELERMKSLVDQFVSLGKPTNIRPTKGNLYQLINDTVELMNSNARLHNVDIRFDASNTELTVYMDQDKIKQVLINFIKNALEAMPNGGNIRLEFQEDEAKKAVTISIADEGEGMTEEQAANLGTPFFTTKESGLGMGLPICFDIIKSHNGNINIDSEKGKGTTIQLSLPLSPA